MYVEVEQDWPGETVFVIGGGPSVRDLDLTRLRGRKVIAVNTSVFSYPWAQAMFWNDTPWFEQWGNRLADYRGEVFTGCTWSQFRDTYKQLHKCRPTHGLSQNRREVAMSFTSVQGAANIAFHRNGGAPIVLVGVDCKPAEDGARNHHPAHDHKTRDGWAERWIEDFGHMAEAAKRLGVDVINANPDSACPHFRKVPFESLVS